MCNSTPCFVDNDINTINVNHSSKALSPPPASPPPDSNDFSNVDVLKTFSNSGKIVVSENCESDTYENITSGDDGAGECLVTMANISNLQHSFLDNDNVETGKDCTSNDNSVSPLCNLDNERGKLIPMLC